MYGEWFAELESAMIFSGDMAVSVEMHHAGDPASQREVALVIEHLLADRPGDWRVSIVGSQANDRWEMKIVGPNAFERSYTLEGPRESITRKRFALFWAGCCQ